ncbi:UNVERIFIED_CONTAM: Kolavenyl diphosphate synthase TPS5, chloroplastic [Sesamum radiatum]|uniref:Kolavenyl diphosphate synthase TPS5, chloroplastic n=1 Tax=Sesamum radiatum TaxID=300843 RepID=A0AAW2US03_SESRA
MSSVFHHHHHHPTSLLPSSTAPRGLYAVLRFPVANPLARSTGVSEYIDVIQSGLPVIKWHEIVDDDTDQDSTHHHIKEEEELIPDKIREMVELVRSMLQSMDDGEISVSPYDTAWVALVEDISAGGRPQFPASLEWISNNQLPDGSWGDSDTFSIYDRIINTLACVVALRSWNIHPDRTDKGILFIKENIYKLEGENEEHMPIGFEVALPSVIQMAKKLDIDIPVDSPGLQEIYARRELKLTRIPRDIMHKVPTTLLHSLEGMPDLMWQKLLKLQSVDGSFLFSPSSTAFALQQTKDHNCLNYLANHLKRFKGGGTGQIKEYAGQEIPRFRTLMTRQWVQAFEVARLPDFCRASQLIFPGEKILADAGKFAAKFLQRKRANNELLDKWIITKDLPGEVGYALDVPWYASLPRVETRFYLEQYGGEDDVWIGKTLYRMPYVNNNTYLELAKLDYSNCQALHQQEWKSIQKWYRNCNLAEFGLSESRLLVAYYIAAASVFEPERSKERLAWAKTSILMETIASHPDLQQLSREQKRDFVNIFEQYGCILNYANGGRYETRNNVVSALIKTVSQLSLNVLLAHGRDIHHSLNHAWYKWLKTWESEGGDTTRLGVDAELLVRTLNLCRGGRVSEETLLSHPKYNRLLDTTVRVCHQLRLFQHQKVQDSNGCICTTGGITTVEIESDMQELVKLVLTKSSDDLDSRTKHNFLTIARSYYYAAYCSPGTINYHIAKVLFERVL